jgi:hypothetical protein
MNTCFASSRGLRGVAAAMLLCRLGAVHAAAIEQPLPFSHKHHVAELGLDCRDCHQTVEISAYAGMPSGEKCTSCHSQLVAPPADALVLNANASVRNAYRLRDFVNFDHSVHAAKGVACANCHGDVERTPGRAEVSNLTTGWCVDCHRHPERIADAAVLHAISALPFGTVARRLLAER